MKLKTYKLSAMLITLFLSTGLLAFDTPKGWRKAGKNPKNYHMGIDKGAGMDGGNAATLKAKKKRNNGWGNLMQSASCKNYLGKRIRMSGYMKTQDVSGWAGYWLRIDDNTDNALSFDNMRNGKKDRSIKGTTDWKKYEIVLDVPESAIGMAFGAMLIGEGQIWFDKVVFEIVDSSVPVTGTNTYDREPANLDFEE